MYLFGATGLATNLSSLWRDRFEFYYHPSFGECAVCYACMGRVKLVIFFFFMKKNEHFGCLNVARVQLWICGRGFEPRQAI